MTTTSSSKILTPEEFEAEMLSLRKKYGEEGEDDEEIVHLKMDELMCDLLTALGYEKGVAVFDGTGKWYS